jgi:periplasmic protein TonB
MVVRTISAPKSGTRRSRGSPIASRGRRFLLTAAVLSIAIHFAVALMIVLLPRVVSPDARPLEEGTVELLMVEKEGAQLSTSGQPQEHRLPPLREEEKPSAPEQQAQESDAQAAVPRSVAAPPALKGDDEPSLKPNEEAPQKAAQAADEPDSQTPLQAPKAQEAPVFDLAGTESESNAEVLGGRVVPASPDDRFRNRPPIYPREAATRGEHGAVVILIHVSETGVATGVDVMETSGVTSLDKAAVDAVRKWHFRPALQEGRTVPFDMRFRFIFDAS